ncbi:MAG TPA: hypothetical protein VJH04_03025 [archaeon]|nr:hypothetical protein [archaeon]
MKYDGVLIALYILALIVVARTFFDTIGLTIVIVLLILMMVVQKSGLEKMIKSVERDKDNKLGEILAKVDDVAKKVDNFKDDVNRQVVFVDNKVADLRHFVEVEVQSVHGELSRQVVALEDRLNELKQSMSSAVGSLDDRIRVEEIKEEKEENTDEEAF